MRIIVSALLFAIVFSSVAFGQDVPRAEVFGGYSYLNLDTNGLTSRQSANGWEAAVSGNLNRWLAIEGDFAGYYKTYAFDLNLVSPGAGVLNVGVHDYSYLGGPRLNFGPVFVHGLVGGDRLTGSALGFSASQDSFAAAFGGGIQWKVAPKWAVRASGDYVLTRHNIFGSPLQTFTQNNFRASVGIVYIFGGWGGSTPRAPHRADRRTAAQPQCEDNSEAALLGVVGCSAPNGLMVTSVRAGSPAAGAGIAAGDVVTSIDGRPVHNSREIEAAIAANTSGTVKVSYMMKGNWLTEREAKVR